MCNVENDDEESKLQLCKVRMDRSDKVTVQCVESVHEKSLEEGVSGRRGPNNGKESSSVHEKDVFSLPLKNLIHLEFILFISSQNIICVITNQITTIP